MKNIKKTLALPGLVLATIFWGFSFVVCKDAVHVISPIYMIAMRFTIASVLMIPFLYKKIRHMTLQDLKCGILIGIALFASYAFQTYGVKYTTAGNNAFLTTTYVIMVPFLYWIVTKKRPDVFTLSAAVLAMAGIGLLTLGNGIALINALYLYKSARCFSHDVSSVGHRGCAWLDFCTVYRRETGISWPWGRKRDNWIRNWRIALLKCHMFLTLFLSTDNGIKIYPCYRCIDRTFHGSNLWRNIFCYAGI